MTQTCLVTGASGEIGVEIAKELGNQGFQLILHYHKNKNSMETLLKELPKGAIKQIIQADLSHTAGIRSFCEQLPDDIYSAVFVSGRSLFGLMQDTKEEDMDMMFHLHVKSNWMITKRLLPDMIKRQRGKFVVISSIWGGIGASCEVVYSSVKGAQNSFVKALAKEVAPSNIQVNGVSPGFIDTKMNSKFTLEERTSIFNEIPAGRPGKAEEIAKVVGFLMTENVNYLQGQIIGVDGAWS